MIAALLKVAPWFIVLIFPTSRSCFYFAANSYFLRSSAGFSLTLMLFLPFFFDSASNFLAIFRALVSLSSASYAFFTAFSSFFFDFSSLFFSSSIFLSASAFSFSFFSFSSLSFSFYLSSSSFCFSASVFSFSDFFLSLPAALSAYLPTPFATAPIPAMIPEGFFSFFLSSRPTRAASTSVKRSVCANACYSSTTEMAWAVEAEMAARRSPPWNVILILRTISIII